MDPRSDSEASTALVEVVAVEVMHEEHQQEVEVDEAETEFEEEEAEAAAAAADEEQEEERGPSVDQKLWEGAAAAGWTLKQALAASLVCRPTATHATAPSLRAHTRAPTTPHRARHGCRGPPRVVLVVPDLPRGGSASGLQVLCARRAALHQQEQRPGMAPSSV